MSDKDVYEYDADKGKNVLALYGLSSGEATGIFVALLIIPVLVAGYGIFVAVRRKFL